MIYPIEPPDPKRTPEEQEDHDMFQLLSPGDYMDWKESERMASHSANCNGPEPLLFEPALWLFVISLVALLVVVWRHW